MQGDNNKTTREILFEVRRDVKWICLALQEIKECRDDHENRLRRLERIERDENVNGRKGNNDSVGFGWGSIFRESCGGGDTKDSKIIRLCAGIGAGAGGIVAVLVRLLD